MERGRDGVRGLKHEAQKLALEGICFVCLQPVVPCEGIYVAWLQCLTHRGECHDRLRAEYRVFDRSSRGRWRPVNEVLARVKAKRQDENSRCGRIESG